MTASSVSVSAVIRTLVLAGFFLLLAWLSQTGELAKFINPRFDKLTELTACLLLAMSIAQAARIFQKPGGCGCGHGCGHSHKASSLPFVLTLMAAVLLPNNGLDASIAANKGLNARLIIDDAYGRQNVPRPLAGQLAKTGLIQVNDINYTEVMFELNNFPQDYVGKEIEMTGFVMKDAVSPDAHIALARYVIVCCVADASPYGVQCEYENIDRYPADTWLNVHGTIRLGKEQDRNIPVIKVTGAKPVAKPARPYVYPGYE